MVSSSSLLVLLCILVAPSYQQPPPGLDMIDGVQALIAKANASLMVTGLYPKLKIPFGLVVT